MIYTLEDVFNQAMNHRATAVSKGEKEHFGLWHGVKISKDIHTNNINIYNTTIGGDYYMEISRMEYESFINNGWIGGVCTVRVNNCERKINNVNANIQNLMNKKSFSHKKYHGYKKARIRHMSNYAEVLKEINNLIKNQKNGNNKNNEVAI